MHRARARVVAALTTMVMVMAGLAIAAPSAAPLSNPQFPQLRFTRTITSHPFAGASANASDIEGLGYVPADNSMWVADDNRDTVWEINPTTGAYKSQLRGSTATTDFTVFATQVGTGKTCGQALQATIPGDTAADECHSRTDDFESVVYDPTSDVLYVTSGNCCTAGLPVGYPNHPTVWKLTRLFGHFFPTSWQALPEGTDPTAAGWRPGVGLYFGHGTSIQTYNFATNVLGAAFTPPGVSTDIVGIAFTDASTALITTATTNTAAGRTTATSDSTITKYTVSGSTFTKAPGWTFPLASVGIPGGAVDDDGMIDARDLAVVGDTLYVSDGYDQRASGDHPIDVYTLGNAVKPTPAFTWTGPSDPQTVQFTSTGQPTPGSASPAPRFTWTFGDGAASTLANPSHTYAAPGTYTVTLTVTNAAGFTSVSHTVVVPAAPVISPGIGGVIEGNTGTVTLNVPVTLSHASSTNVTVHFATADTGAPGVATAGVDYVPTSGTLTFTPGQTSKTVPITVIGDTVKEPPLLYGEWILVAFSSATGATIEPRFFGLGIGIIGDDD